MATAQQLIIDQFVTLINANPNINGRVIASSPAAGILRVTTRGAEEPRISYLAAGSNVTGAGTFAAKAVTGSPKYAELWFSWTLAPGDTVKLNAGTNIQSLDLTYQLPLGTTVDAGGFDHTTIGGAGGGVAVGGSGIGSALHRRMVVMECGSASSSFGSMFALDPQDATGVAIPAFRVANALPIAGSSRGEAVFVTATRSAFVWDGVAWRDVTASPIRSFPNDNALQQDVVEAVGVYAVATDTGNMYVRAIDGWRRVGKSEFSTYADLLNYNAPLGSEAVVNDLDVVFLRTNEGGVPTWQPVSTMAKSEADILATQNIQGLQAVSTDSGRTYVNDGTRWVEQPIDHFPTEAALLASPPIAGHLAWSDDTNVVFVAAAGAWKRLQGPQISVGTTAPTGPATGDMWYAKAGNNRGLQLWDATDANPANHGWQQVASSEPPGSITQSLLTEAQFNAALASHQAGQWVLADGRNVAGTRYAQITGRNTVPDLRGAYLRMAGTNSTSSTWQGGTLNTFREDTTRMPRNTAFTGSTSTNGNHTHDGVLRPDHNCWNSGGCSGANLGTNNPSGAAGNHSHTVTINGGGDTETAPKTYVVNTFIKVN
jgi:hypothetical protein